MVWLTCLALLLGGAMAGWGQLIRASEPGPGQVQVDLLADWCASPADTVGPAAEPAQKGGLGRHAQAHCDLCVVAADLPSPPALQVPLQVPEATAGWRPTAAAPGRSLLPWQRPQPRGPPRRA